MHFSCCPHCGSKLTERSIGDEGLVPYCEACRVPLWDVVTPCVICAICNEMGEVALIQQSYGDTFRYVCIAGYMKPGESAEDAARREIREEIGLEIQSLRYVRSFPYVEKELLMLGFTGTVKKAGFTLSTEVKAAHWIPLCEAASMLREGSIARQLVEIVCEEDSAHAT